MVRVIAGTFKGRNLKIPSNWPGRPTADRIKEALFNILAPAIRGSKFLDLFAGSGNVGIEALSRGADSVCFVEKDSRMVNAIFGNLNRLQAKTGIHVLQEDVLDALQWLHKKGESFDIIFLDPPYRKGMESPAIESISAYNLLKPDGILIAESDKREVLPSGFKNLTLTRQEKYGDTLLTFYGRARSW